jgi:hypothetical protein
LPILPLTFAPLSQRLLFGCLHRIPDPMMK